MKAIDKDTIRAIKKSRMRFFYICAIIALGVAFFCGMKAVSPSMIETAVSYFSQYNLSDFRLISSYGFREEDINELNNVDGVERALGAYSMDVIMQLEDEKAVIKIMSLSEDGLINAPQLLEGRMPESYDECVIEEPARHLTGYKIGDRINVLDESHTPEELENLKTRSFLIVGYIQTPQYISIERGNTTISDGSIDGYMMVPPESFNYERFTEAYVYTDVSANNTNPYSDEYSNAQEQMISSLETVGDKILDDNLADIKSSAEADIKSGEEELRENEAAFKTQIADAHQEIETQTQKLIDGFNEYRSGVRTFEEEIANAQAKIQAGELELYNGQLALQAGRNQLFSSLSAAQETLNQARNLYISGLEEYNAGRLKLNVEYNQAIAQINQGWVELNMGYRLYSENLKTFNDEMSKAEAELNTAKLELDQGMSQYESLKASIDEQFIPAENSLKEGYASYEKALLEYEAELESFDEQTEAAQALIDQGRQEYEIGEESYQSNYELYEEKLEIFNREKENLESQIPGVEEQIEEAQGRLESAKGELSEVESEIGPLQEQKNPLSEELENYNSEISKIESEISEADSKISENKSSIEEINKKLEQTPDDQSLIAERDRLESQISELEEVKSTKAKSLEEVKSKKSDVEGKIAEIDEELSPLIEKKSSIEEQIESINAEISEKQNYIDSVQNELNEREAELSEVGATLESTREKLDSLKAELDARQQELDQMRLEKETLFENAKKELDATYQSLQHAQEELDQKREEAYKPIEPIYDSLLKAQAELESAQVLFQTQREEGLFKLNSALYELTKSKEELVMSEDTLNRQIIGAKAELESAEEELNKAKAKIDSGQQELVASRAMGLAQLNEAQNTLLVGQNQLNSAKLLFYNQRDAGLRELNSAYQTLQNGQRQLDQGKEELQKQETEGQRQIDEGWKRINDSRQKLRELGRGDWYVYSRDDNPGYSGYQQDAERIDNVANVFPLFFFLVAALVAFTTMTRMVEEERTQIGTLYALGYTRGQILKKYILYAGLGALIGSTVGWILGVFTLPLLIFWAYNILYQMPDLILTIPWHMIVISYLLSFVCTIGAAIVVALSELRSVPAELMRPKAPKPGKRILLERIPFIWNRLGFITKVSMRNIFRYKARFLMTVIGIAGCTALILAGFGLHDAIFTIVPSQFGVINHYDQSLIIKDTSTDLDAKLGKVIADTRVTGAMPVDQETISVVTKNGSPDAYLIVPRDPGKFSDFVSLHERTKRDVPISLTEDGIVVSEKLATNYDAKPGEVIELEIDNKKYKAKVSAQTENYLENYVYMSPALYQRIVGKNPDYSVIYVNFTDDLTEEKDQEAFASDMIATGDFTSAINVSTMIDTSNKTMQSLNVIVIVMIVSAGALSFIVLNNLTNINISERVREIATLKVLGFRSKETNNYIFRENIILSFFGIALGLILGIILLRFIIATVELDIIMFGREIHPLSYLYSILLTLGFTIIVNYTMIPVIKRIDMVEALKDID